MKAVKDEPVQVIAFVMLDRDLIQATSGALHLGSLHRVLDGAWVGVCRCHQRLQARAGLDSAQRTFRQHYRKHHADVGVIASR